MYLISDIKKILGSKIFRIVLILYLIIAIADPLYVYFGHVLLVPYLKMEDINAIMFWLPVNNVTPFSQAFRIMNMVLPTFIGGLLYYFENKSSVLQFLVVRRNRFRYILSKAISVYVVALFVYLLILFVNMAIVYNIFPLNLNVGEGFKIYLPQKGFVYDMFMKNQLYVPIFFNLYMAFQLAFFSLISALIHMILRTRNIYLAIAVPIIVFQLHFHVASFIDVYANYTYEFLSQPLYLSIANTVESISPINYLISLGIMVAVSVVLFIISLYRNREQK